MIDFNTLNAQQCYKLMVNLIVPRPIAWVTTLGSGGVVNAAPFSVFNMVGEDPPLVMISVNKLGDGNFKDTARNILELPEFVVHIVDEATAAQMDATAAELPASESELTGSGLTVTPSTFVKPPRITQAPVAFECKLWETMESDSRFVFFGRIRCLHAKDGLVDTERWRVDFSKLNAVGRYGAGLYVHTQDRFKIVSGQYVSLNNETAPT